MIIDSHCHAGKGDGLTGPWDTNAPLNDFVKWSDEAGINRIVLFPAFHSDYSIANKKVSDIVKKFPDRFYGYAFIHCERDKGRIFNMVKTAVEQYGFCGIKCHRYDAHISREVCEAARKFSLPVLYDVMGDVSSIDLFANEYPDVNFIIPHLGTFADSWKIQLSFMGPLSRFNNIFTDTSGVRRFDMLRMAYDKAGPNKILFGTDGPWLHPAVELSKVYALNLSDKETNLITGGNFLRLTKKSRAVV